MSSSSFFLSSLVFLELEPRYVCLRGVQWESCKAAEFCENKGLQWKIDWTNAESLSNFIMYFDLYCDSQFKIGLFGSLFLAGIVLGSVTLTRLGDIYGRKPIFLIGMAIQILTTVGVLMNSNIMVAYALFFIIGFGVTGKQFVGFSYLVEMQPHYTQAYVSSFEFIFEAFVYLFVVIYFSLISKTWQYVGIPSLGLGVIGCLSLLSQPESPRFLISVGEYEKARQVFKRIARVNNQDPSKFDKVSFAEEDIQQKMLIIQDEITSVTDNLKSNRKKSDLKELLQNSQLRANLILANFIWCSLMINYYILAFYLKYFPGNIYENTLYMIGADLLAYIVSGTLMKKTDLKKSLVLAQIISIIGSSLYQLVYTNDKIIPFVVIFCRFGISMSFNSVYIGNNRLFPTQFQSTTFGFLNFLSHCLSVGAPIIAEISDPIPILIFLGCCVITLISAIFLKEVNRDLLNQIK
ncbi:solute carrier family member 5 [Stylonychia lemnae]|uniref:Solute carrier family member 5 n=1 Tax=Stylonychia lemnae TaxID=5949 RepID=A0A078A708_STYLE|nr:solute carrier family member 5 [Stylonychia lemnae]|eukprot:CDW78040.1 solute carrier family member 5 [Stylonychia lemnae]